MKSPDIKDQGGSLSGKLSIIDKELEQVAKNHNTSVISPQITYSRKVEDSLENRMIEWSDRNIGKAIIIRPHTDVRSVRSDAWDVINIAWVTDAPTFEKPLWECALIRNADITTLKKNIDQLLAQSEKNLNNIKIEDIK